MKVADNVVVTVSVPQPTLKLIDELALREYRRKKGARSKIISKALQEYLDHHYPGQPQPPLFDRSKMFDPAREKAAICFLRFQVKLPIRKIAKIVGRSVGYVHKECERIGNIEVPQWPRNRRFPYDFYRKGFERVMQGEEPKVAFRHG